jgi:BON domain
MNERDRGAFGREAVDQAEEITDTRVYEGDLEARPPEVLQPDADEVTRLQFLEELELREGETDDPNEAAEEGLTYIPPVDPPVVGLDADGDPRIAAGFATAADDEPFDLDHHTASVPVEDEFTARVREALLANAQTSGFADDLILESEGGVVRVAGRVPDLVDEEAILAVVSDVPGVVEVDNQVEVDAVQ